MDRILPYASIVVWTMLALSSSGAWVAVVSLAIIAGCLLFVVAGWLGGFVCDLYERVRQARKPRTQPGNGPLWTVFGTALAQVSRGLLKDLNAGQRPRQDGDPMRKEEQDGRGKRNQRTGVGGE